METAGYLFQKIGKNWRRCYVEIKNGNLYSQKSAKDEPQELTNLLLATVRLADSKDENRRFCFEVISPNERFVLQAENEEILQYWIHIIQNAIAHALNHNQPNAKKSGLYPAEDAMSSSNSFLQKLREHEENRFCADCGDLSM